jgi:hypothetical protein
MWETPSYSTPRTTHRILLAFFIAAWKFPEYLPLKVEPTYPKPERATKVDPTVALLTRCLCGSSAREM